MAGSPLEAMTLLGLGYRRLSMSAPSIEPVKAMLRSLQVGELETYLGQVIHSADHSLRNKLIDFARDHQVEV